MDQHYSSGELMAAIKHLQEATAAGFAAVDHRFAHFQFRIDSLEYTVNRRFETLEDKMTRRFDSVDLRLDGLERRVGAVEHRGLSG